MRTVLPNFKAGTRSLKTQLALYFIPATLIPVLGLSYFATHTFEKNGRESFWRQAQSENELIQGELELIEKNIIQQTRRAATNTGILKSLSSRKQKDLDSYLGSLRAAGKFRIYSPEGDFIAEGPGESPKRPRVYYISREGLKKIKSLGNVTERYFSDDDNSLLILSRALIQDEDKLYGVIEQEYHYGTSQLSELRKSRQVEVLFIQRDFNKASSSLSIGKEDLKSLSKHLISNSIKASKVFQPIWIGESRYASYLFDLPDVTGKNKEWAYLGLLIPLTQSDSATRQARLNVIIITVLLALAFGYLIFIFSNQIVKPIEVLVSAMKTVKTGNLEEIPASDSSYEIDYLISAFNEMIRNVSAARRALENKIQELRKANNEIRNTQTALVQSAKMISLGQIVAGVAHELNNPLAFIYSNMHHLSTYIERVTRLIQEYQKMKKVLPVDEQTRFEQLEKELDISFILSDMTDLTRSCLDGANRTKDIVMGLRTFSRMDEFVFRPADLHEGIKSTLRLLNAELKNRITVHQEFGDIPPVECSISQLNQVFMNLIVNAAQAISGKGTVWIRTRRVVDQVEIEIEDSGPGMSEDTLSHIFVPFFTTKKVGEGTGLGLSIAYGLVEKHQGRIEVHSELGKGTLFRISLPIVQKHQAVS